MKTNLRKVVKKIISGEWGDDDFEGKGTNIIRTTNFESDGKIDYTNITTRLIRKKITSKEGKIEYVVDTAKIKDKSLIDGDIIIEKSGGGPGSPVGRVVYFENPSKQIYLSNNFTQTLRVDNTVAYPKFIFYYLKYLYAKGNVLKYQNQTTGIFNLKIDRYLQEEITLYELDKQNSIIAQLDTIQTLISDRNKSILICEELRKATFINFFIDNVEREKWGYKELAGYIKSKKYGSANALNNDSGYPTIRMNNITYRGTLDLSDIKYIQLSEDEFKKYELQNRDVLFNRTNSIELVGKCAVWENLKGYMYAGYLFTLKLNEKLLNPYYLTAYLNSDLGKVVLKNKAKQSGSMANFSASLLAKQKILIPPIDLQNQFEQEIRKINQQIEFLNQSKLILQNLFQSALQNTFNSNKDIDEQPIFKDLIKKLSVKDLTGNKVRLNYLLQLFQENLFDTVDDYTNVKNKLYELILSGQIVQKISDEDKITLEVK